MACEFVQRRDGADDSWRMYRERQHVIASARAPTDLAIVYEAHPREDEAHPREDEPRAINSDNGSDTGYFCVPSPGTMGRIFNRRWRRPVFIFERPGGQPTPALPSPSPTGGKKLLYLILWYFTSARLSRGQFAARSGLVSPRVASFDQLIKCTGIV